MTPEEIQLANRIGQAMHAALSRICSKYTSLDANVIATSVSFFVANIVADLASKTNQDAEEIFKILADHTETLFPQLKANAINAIADDLFKQAKEL